MADDEDLESPPGEFPPGLEVLNAEIERLASSQSGSEDIQGQVERITGQAVHFVDEARRALAQAHGDIDALPDWIREALAEVTPRAAAMLSSTGSLGLRGLSFSGVGLVEAAGGVDSLEVQKSRSVLNRLPPAYVYYLVLIWLLVTGVSVVMERFKLPPDVVEQLQTDPNYAGLALTLTIAILAARNRRK